MKISAKLLLFIFTGGCIDALPLSGNGTESAIQKLERKVDQLYTVVSQLEMKIMTQPVSCPAGYTEFQGSCYMFVRYLMSWDDAEKNCQRFHGNLVTIQSAAEQDFLTDYITKNGDLYPHWGFWTGGIDRGANGMFRWTKNNKLIQNEGDFLGWDYFDSGTTQSNQDCMVLWRNRGYLWHDLGCQDKMHSVCEIEK
ncbi:perlucin-like protein [Lingula anatina]|uniref:Perlucin-like protein n=1 Tax=Lingula anatina TaxID=7574 RepID=A0A1S3I3F2_LINAN|nr:perlucin-like protein [Lingula anatina]|eukprot:XP_013392800.1 perlucin-like protein [Lingula anatina]